MFVSMCMCVYVCGYLCVCENLLCVKGAAIKFI